jgi:O-antigen chain-terminating methyltransferase
VLPSTGVAPAPSVGTRRKTIAQRLDVRILLQRLLGVRQVVKLGNQLEPLRHGPVPLQGLPGAVNELRRSVSELDRLKLQTAEAAARAKKMEERVGADLAAANVGIADLSSRYEALKQVNARIADLSSRYEALPQDLAARLEGLERIIDSLASSINILHDTTARILRRAADQGRRLDLLIAEARSRLPEPLAREQIETFEEVGRDRLAALYVDFEDRFRGDRPDIAGRQSIYLSHIRDAAELTGLKTFLDIGCGRGEFLELLKNAGLEPRGVDSNAVMVAACCDLGLEATKADGVSHLRGLPDGQLAGVSGFHIIEHISYDALIALIDAALGALAPGGVLILETPNPANLLVAAERFYFDPTHRNPLPSEMMAFMVEARGFVDVEIVPLHPVDHLQRRYEDPMLALLQEKLYGPQDYGVVARKPR